MFHQEPCASLFPSFPRLRRPAIRDISSSTPITRGCMMGNNSVVRPQEQKARNRVPLPGPYIEYQASSSRYCWQAESCAQCGSGNVRLRSPIQACRSSRARLHIMHATLVSKAIWHTRRHRVYTQPIQCTLDCLLYIRTQPCLCCPRRGNVLR